MGRRLNRNDSAVQFEKYYRGCIWGLLPLQFQSFKKLMPQTRHKPERDSTNGQNQKPSKEFEEGGGRRKGQVPERPRLQRTYSIHHLEPSSRFLDGLSLDPKHRVVINKISNASEPEICVDLSDLSEQDEEDEYPLCHKSSSSSETYEDFFEAFKIDRKLFLENTQKMDAEDLKFLKSNQVASLRRSGSFPVANKPGGRHGGLTPIKLENKLTEVWPWPSSSSLFSSCSSSSTSSSSSSSFHRSVNMLARSRSMDCKLPVDAYEDLLTAEKSSQIGDYASDVRRYKLSRNKRACSLNGESLERYAQLFETSFGRDMKLIAWKSLKLPNQDEGGFNQSEFKSLKKTHSMQEALLIERSDSIEFSKARYEFATLRSDGYREQSESEVSEDEPAATDHTMSDVSAVGNVIDSTKNEHDEVAAAADRISYPEPERVEDHAENESCTSRPSFKISGESQAETHLDPNAARLNPNDSLQAQDSSVDSTYLQATLIQLGVDTEINLKNDTDRQLLSDLVNEALLGLYGGSDAYWPASLCSNCQMHRLPSSEQHVFKKVKSTIQKLESFSLKAGNTMDSLVAFDLAGDQAWISLQADAESLGLALDEMIFDELMDELIYE